MDPILVERQLKTCMMCNLLNVWTNCESDTSKKLTKVLKTLTNDFPLCVFYATKVKIAQILQRSIGAGRLTL